MKDFRGAWATGCKKAGLTRRILHDFWRTAVRNLERVVAPCSVARKLIGHETDNVHRRYTIASEADLSTGVAKLPALQPLEERPAEDGIITALTQIEGIAR
jgi:hypothetical protein